MPRVCQLIGNHLVPTTVMDLQDWSVKGFLMFLQSGCGSVWDEGVCLAALSTICAIATFLQS